MKQEKNVAMSFSGAVSVAGNSDIPFVSQEVKDKFDYRIQLLRDTFDHKKTDRIPLMGNIQSWMHIDAGYTILEASRDYDKCIDAGRKLCTKYPLDITSIGNGIVRNPIQVHEALSKKTAAAAFDVPGDGNTINAIFEDEMIKADEYDEMIEDFQKVLWEKAFLRTYPDVKDFTPEEWANAVKSRQDLMAARRRAIVTLRGEFGVVDQLNVPVTGCFAETLFNSYRGIKGFALDMRRQPAKVEEICRIRDSASNDGVYAALKADAPGHNMTEPYDVLMSFLAYSIMTPKQFERFCLPTLKKTAEICQETGKQIAINTEASFERFGEYFNDYKKGVINCIVEMDDPYVIRKKFPNIGIIGGLDVGTMGGGTPEECVDMAKKAIEEIGRDGGLLLSANKFCTYPKDMNAENLKAVCDFVLNYKL